MKIDKELIEKYHLGLCSVEETKAVENWLLNDEVEELLLPQNATKQELKNEIWTSISTQIPEIQKQDKVISLHNYLSPTFWQAIAATLLIGVALTIFWKYNGQVEIAITEVEQSKATVQQIVGNKMNILLGKESKAEFTLANTSVDGNIDFCGTIRIDPKQDMELTIHGTCENNANSEEKMSLKKGQTYIAVNYQFNEANELIVVDERNLINLPPLMQREIMKQFPI